MGLGLAIAQSARASNELHGGTVSANSSGENQGATFTVQLPMMREESTIVTESATSKPMLSDVPLNGIRILVVDDDADKLDFQAFLLE